MNRKLFPVVGLLVAAAVFGPSGLNKSRLSMPASGVLPLKTQTVPAKPTTSQSEKKEKPVAMKLVPRSQLGPWVASCRFFGGPDRSPGVNLDMLKPSKAQIKELSNAEPDADPDVPSRKIAPAGQAPKSNRWCTEDNPSITFVIAMVPDPVNSHLALDFDRRIEAMQSAAQDAGYFNNQFWIPWDTSPLTGSTLEEKNDELMLRQVREAQPGIQIFRGLRGQEINRSDPRDDLRKKSISQPDLFVFFVAETTTLGINKAQLTAAINYILEIVPASKDISVLGPVSSGSIAFLGKYLSSAAWPHLRFRIITASATDHDALEQLRQAHNITFQQLLHEDSIALGRFFGYARNSLHLEEREIAILSESGTKYGQGASFDVTDAVPGQRNIDAGVHVFKFPRQISVLRNAYPDQQSKPGGDNKVSIPGVALDLKQTLGQTDDVPVMSMGELPSSQQAVLAQTAAQIRRDRVKLVGIVASDIFDTLFLARFLKEVCPDVRLFLLDSDLLLIRAAEDYPLEGTLVISNYPLITGSDAWDRLSSVCPTELHFANRSAEATYNGFSELINDKAACLKDYAFIQGHDEPPLWLSVVGRNGYWPITILPPQPKEEPVQFVSSTLRSFFTPESPSNGYLLLCGLLMAVSVLEFLLFLAAQWPRVRSLRWLLQYFYLGDMQRARPKAFFFMSASLILATLDYVVFLPVWVSFATDWHLMFWYLGLAAGTTTLLLGLFYHFFLWRTAAERRYTYYLVTASLVIIVLSSFIFYRSTIVGESNWFPHAWYSGLSIVTLVITLLCIGRAVCLHSFWISKGTRQEERGVWFSWAVFLAFYVAWSGFVFPRADEAKFFRYRCFDIAGGTSPVLPFLFLLIGLYLWCWIHVRRIQFGQAQHAIVPAGVLDHQYYCGFRNLVGLINRATQRTDFHPISLVIFFCVFAGGTVLLPQKYIAGIEVAARSVVTFDWLYIFTLTLLYAVIFVSLFRFVYLWSALQQLLRRLERQPLRHAFNRLPKKYYSWTPLWYSGAARRTYAVLARSLEGLRKLNRDHPSELPQLSTHVTAVETTLGSLFRAEAAGIIDLSEQSKNCKEAVRTASSYVLQEFLIPHWLRVGDSEVSSEITEKSSAGGGDSKQIYLQLGKKPPAGFDELEKMELVQAAEEVVALRFIALIRYVGLQLRNQLTFISAAFILSIVSLRSYPFLGHRTIGWSLTVIFIVLAIGIVLVFAQMDKDAILSRITDTEPGKLDKEFYFRVISVGTLPLLTVLGSQFPEIGRILFSWVQPAVEALH